ncbi:class I lanthipeptide [Kordia jejudonensis]|uniref:class I lanthipeptide n=1 Tax=Kordia jejudonensis TaxID=1348245 RepID=UPI0006291703|nr:class I lanthipeptide [Kordia jejudonensis]
MKKRNLNKKLNLQKDLVSNLETENLKGGLRTDICTGLQDTCSNCQGPTKQWPCPTPTRGDWTCNCPQL